ncbi:uncharacterized protein si:dkeyp-97a10.2 isoform X2 [Triplophysa rosa]|uniref:uncharacterized protein si:dkeyp-97a10.2 isoform X2 n=1 Tax=Triplophysa rosa TaxID=992332 RepID=UPI002545F7EE|nr:uncharacterized protein si:dkeyp-97a10.2 isoform X2 [Triplophysa rosa]XP_057195344.1 uncharacterized protein si:dkeyp-97a10.2 isoform X2 [Triplophysa rosa]
MELQQRRFYWTFLLYHVCPVLWSCQGLSVRFKTHQASCVIKGQSFILRAQIDLLDGESLTRVTWDHAAKNSGKNYTVAEFPRRTSDEKVTLEEQGAVLKIRGYQPADSGVYTITVINQAGQRRSAQQTVREYLAVNHVSVMVNVSHSVLHCMEAWGSEPTFTWLHEKVVVTEEVGRVSADGRSLHVSGTFCGHFTCVVSNKLGYSSATYTAEACEQDDRHTTAVVVCFLLLLAIIAARLAFMLWRRHQRNRRQRLWESYENTL